MTPAYFDEKKVCLFATDATQIAYHAWHLEWMEAALPVPDKACISME